MIIVMIYIGHLKKKISKKIQIIKMKKMMGISTEIRLDFKFQIFKNFESKMFNMKVINFR